MTCQNHITKLSFHYGMFSAVMQITIRKTQRTPQYTLPFMNDSKNVDEVWSKHCGGTTIMRGAQSIIMSKILFWMNYSKLQLMMLLQGLRGHTIQYINDSRQKGAKHFPQLLQSVCFSQPIGCVFLHVSCKGQQSKYYIFLKLVIQIIYVWPLSSCNTERLEKTQCLGKLLLFFFRVLAYGTDV